MEEDAKLALQSLRLSSNRAGAISWLNEYGKCRYAKLGILTLIFSGWFFAKQVALGGEVSYNKDTKSSHGRRADSHNSNTNLHVNVTPGRNVIGGSEQVGNEMTLQSQISSDTTYVSITGGDVNAFEE